MLEVYVQVIIALGSEDRIKDSKSHQMYLLLGHFPTTYCQRDV